MTGTVNTEELEGKVKDMYRQVAQQPHDTFHFELGAPVALRVGYDADLLAALPHGATESSAGVGHFFDLADLQPGESVVDLGSGSGMDAFYAAGQVGPTGHVYGVDFTQEQLDKARRLATETGLTHVEFGEGRIEALPLDDAIVCNADLWASCIGGAAQQDVYLQAIESAGFTIDRHRINAYAFISDQARNASATYGVKSLSLVATKTAD